MHLHDFLAVQRSRLSPAPIHGPEQTKPRRNLAGLPVTAVGFGPTGRQPIKQTHRASPEAWPRRAARRQQSLARRGAILRIEF
ncbi:hypothetical protein ACLOJK_034903 [Asimina triloba]